jgi:hypothetical protein
VWSITNVSPRPLERGTVSFSSRYGEWVCSLLFLELDGHFERPCLIIRASPDLQQSPFP